MMPFNAYCINPNGNGTPCCVITNGKAHESMESVFKLPVFLDAQQNENELPDVCSSCRSSEEIYGTSHGNQFTTRFLRENKRFKTPKNVVTHLDLSFSNTCNLDCVMCSNLYSSKWNTLYDRMSDDLFGSLSDMNGYKKKQVHQLSYEQIDDILDNMDDVRRIVIKGGEPFYDKKTKYFLNNLKFVNRNVKLRIISNLTHLDLDLLNHFGNVSVTASIDGIFDVYEWIRGTNFRKIADNFKQLINSHVSTEINFAISAFNIENLVDTYDFFVDLGLTGQDFGTTLVNQAHCHYRNIGRERFEKQLSELNRIPIFTRKQSKMTWDRDPTEEEFKLFNQFKDFMDNVRGMKCPI